MPRRFDLRALVLETRYRLALVLGGLFLTLSFLTRVALLLIQGSLSTDGLLRTLAALAVGEAFDLLAAVWLLVPWMLYLAVMPERWFRRPWQRRAVMAGLFLTTFGILFVAAAELFFFQEFDGRFNFVAVDYLMFPTEVVNNIWESYPTGLILGMIAAASAGTLLLLRQPLRAAWTRPISFGRRAAVTGVFALLVAALTFALPVRLTHVSEDRPLNEIANNGYCAFVGALLGQAAPYDGLYATLADSEVFRRLQLLLAEPAAEPGSFHRGSTLRHIQGLAPERRMNVVVVLEESLGSEFIGTLHPRPASLTPQFDALAREGTLLTNAFSTGNRTIRAIEATTSSLPPLPGVSIVRRPQSENLFTLPALLASRGYQTMFVYGGHALFDGMGGYLQRNGVERIVDQGDFPRGTFTTAWGAADEAIFDKALTEMDALQRDGKPFYSLILSVSNHRPYNFPEGRIQWDPALKRRENAVRYADYALGRFIREAHRHAFFKDTLFVLMGDHGARVYGAAEIPLASYEVPILFYAPGLIPAGRRVDTLASSLDLPPTILGTLGFSYDSKFFGHDVFHAAPAAGRALMTHNSDIALMRGSRMVVLGLHRSAKLYERGPAGSLKPIPAPDAAGRELIQDAIAYYDGADQEYRQGAYAFVPSRSERVASKRREE
jgi:phosphoglycerol transferase MdoB-like AlkP superfamily enzyme